MRVLSPELPVAATRPLDVLLALSADETVVTDPMALDWDTVALGVADGRDRTTVAAAVAAAANHLGFSEPAADTPLVVLQRIFGQLHRAAIAGW